MVSVKVELEAFPEKNIKKRKCLIEDVIMKNEAKVEPLLVDFANGRPLDDSSLTATLHRDVTGEPQRKSRRVITIPTGKLAYAGMNFGQGSQQGRTTTFIGVRDKNTGRMRLIETSAYTVRPLLGINPKVTKSKGTDNSTRTYMEKQEAVVSAFGSKRAKSAVNRMRQYQVDAENMTDAIDQAAKSARVKTVEELKQEEEAHPDSLLELLPPRNVKATRVYNVYRLNDLVHNSLLKCLIDDAMKCMEGDDSTTESYSELVKELLVHAKLNEDENKRLKYSTASLYIHHLQSFLRRPEKLVKFGKRLPKCPEAVSIHIQKKYTSGKAPNKFVTGVQKDKVLVLILILSLVINEFELSAETLLKSLPIMKPRLDTMMTIIGATYQPFAMKYVLTLPLAQYVQKLRGLGKERRKRGKT